MAKATPALEITTAETSAPKPRKRGGKPVAIEEHTVVTKWAEEKKVGAPPPKARKTAPAEEIEDDDDTDDVDVELPDEVQAVLAEYNTGDGLIMEVNRLPHYHLNGKQDPASLVCCGDRDFDPNEYKNILRLYYAKEGVPNFFVLKLKSADRRWIPGGRIGPINVEAATVEEKARHGIYVAPPEPAAAVTINHATPSPYPYAPQPPAPPVDEDAIIDREFTRLERLKKLLNGSESRRDEYAQQPQSVDPDMAMAQYVMKNPDLAKQAINNLIGGESAASKTGVTEMLVGGLIDLVQSVAPTVAPALANFFNAKAQAEQYRAHQFQQQMQQAPTSLPEGVQGQQPPPSFQPEPSMQQQEPSPQQQQAAPQSAYEVIFRTLLNQRKLPAPLNAPHRAVNALWGVHEYYGRLVPPGAPNPLDDAIDAFLDVTPEEVINLAKVFAPDESATIEQPDAAEWIKAVQDEIRKEWESTDEPTTER